MIPCFGLVVLAWVVYAGGDLERANAAIPALCDLPDAILMEIMQCMEPRTLARAAAASKRLQSLSRGLPHWTYLALFDARTTEHDLPRLLSDVSALTARSPALQTAARHLSYADAVLLCDHFTQGRLSVSDQSAALSLLLSGTFNSTVLFRVLVSDLVREDWTGWWAYHYRTPINWLVDPVSRITPCDDLTADISCLPYSVIAAVDDITAELGRMPIAIPFGADQIARVRTHFPPPFNKVFPLNHFVGRRLFTRLRHVTHRSRPVLADQFVVLALLKLGIRLDLLHLIQLDWELNDATGLKAILALTRPERFIFHGLNPNEKTVRLVDVFQPLQAYMEFFESFFRYLPTMCHTASLVAFFRRHPEQIHSAVSAMALREDWAQLDWMAQQAFLAHPQFSALTYGMVDFLLTAESDVIPISASAMIHLITLPSLDLYRKNYLGCSPLYYMFKDVRKFKAVLLSPQFQRRIDATSVAFVAYFLQCEDSERQIVLQFIGRLPPLSTIRQILAPGVDNFARTAFDGGDDEMGEIASNLLETARTAFDGEEDGVGEISSYLLEI